MIAATAIAVLANDTDVDAGPIAVDTVTQPANGTVVITGGGSGLTYQPNPNYCNNPRASAPLDTFTYTLTPGTSTATVSVTVTCVDDAPAITLSGSTPSYTENGAATGVDGGLTVADVDSANLVSGSVTVSVNLVAGDTLTFTAAGGITDTNLAPGHPHPYGLDHQRQLADGVVGGVLVHQRQPDGRHPHRQVHGQRRHREAARRRTSP